MKIHRYYPGTTTVILVLDHQLRMWVTTALHHHGLEKGTLKANLGGKGLP